MPTPTLIVTVNMLSEAFNFFSASESDDAVDAVKENGRRGQDPAWPLEDLMNDIELQINEQNDVILGMTKQMEDIEHSLAAHESLSLSKRSIMMKRNNNSYVQMKEDEGTSFNGEAEPQLPKAKPSIPAPTKSAPPTATSPIPNPKPTANSPRSPILMATGKAGPSTPGWKN